jgi:hypothetical protein
MNRAEILDAVKNTICNDRQDTYGNPEDAHATIACYWNEYLAGRVIDVGGHDAITAQDVAVMMALLKIARHTMNQNHSDSLHDAIGYLAIAMEIKHAEDTNRP